MQPGLSLPLAGQEQLPAGGNNPFKGATESGGLFSGLLMASARKLGTVPEGSLENEPTSVQESEASAETMLMQENPGVAVALAPVPQGQDKVELPGEQPAESDKPSLPKNAPTTLQAGMPAAVSPVADGPHIAVERSVATDGQASGVPNVPAADIAAQSGQAASQVLPATEAQVVLADRPGATAVVADELSGLKIPEDESAATGGAKVEGKAGLLGSGSDDPALDTRPGLERSSYLKVADILELKAKRLLRDLQESPGNKAAYAKPGSQAGNAKTLRPVDPPEQFVSSAESPVMTGEIPVSAAGPLDKAAPSATTSGPGIQAQEQGSEAVSGQPAVSSPEVSHHKSSDAKSPHQEPGKPIMQAEQVSIAHEVHHTAESHARSPHAGNDPVPSLKDGAGTRDGGHVMAAKAHAPVFKQVVANLDLRGGESHVKIQLHPESLGKVEVALVGKGHALEVRIVADSPQAAEALQNNLHELTDGLKAKASGFHHLDVRVEVREPVVIKQDGAQQERRDQQRGQERQEGRSERDSRQDGRDRHGDRRGGKSRQDPRQRTHKEES